MSENIILRKYQPDDFHNYYNLVKEDHVMRYITGKGLTIEQAERKFEEIISINHSDPKLGYYKIVLSDAQEIIGDCKLVYYKEDPSTFEIGYLLKEKYWRRGLGTMICKKLLILAKEIDPLKNIIGIIDPKNQASKRLLEKHGFTRYFIGIENGIPTEKLILQKPI